jgi:nitrite reductase/ring-hydroxylating ferredoxin subunit
MAGRYPFPTTPTGWFHIAVAADVPGDRMVPLHYFGRELALGRTDNGTVVLVDAYCPHLGAHLGWGGAIEGGQIVCPFHGWRFDERGRNVEIPYAARPNRSACLRLWETAEVNGNLLAWHDASGGGPTFSVPTLAEAEDPRFVRVDGERFFLRTHVQEVMENTVDAAHFQFVHRTEGFGAPRLHAEGPMLRSVAPVEFVTPRGTVPGEVESELWGLGIDVVRPRGILEAAVIFAVTPVDDEVVEAGYTFFVPRAPGGGVSRLGQGLMRDFAKQVSQDQPIWEHKSYRPRPALAAGEGAITRYRRWASQFYPGTVEGQEAR